MKHEGTYIDTPELLDAVKSDHLLEQVVPVVALSQVSNANLQTLHPYKLLRTGGSPHLARRRFCKPQSPCVHQRVFDIEVVLVVEHCDRLIARLCCAVGFRWGFWGHVGVPVFVCGGDGDGVKGDGLGGFERSVGHGEEGVGAACMGLGENGRLVAGVCRPQVVVGLV